MPKLAVPATEEWGETLQFILTENLPGSYPYTGGVYPYRREEEDPIRMFAGEGGPERRTVASTISRADMAQRGCRRRSIRRHSTARIPTRVRTSTVARAIPACRSRRSMT